MRTIDADKLLAYLAGNVRLWQLALDLARRAADDEVLSPTNAVGRARIMRAEHMVQAYSKVHEYVDRHATRTFEVKRKDGAVRLVEVEPDG